MPHRSSSAGCPGTSTKKYPGTQHKAEVVPAPVIIHRVDRYIIQNQADEKRNRAYKSVPESSQQAIRRSLSAWVYVYHMRTSGKDYHRTKQQAHRDVIASTSSRGAFHNNKGYSPKISNIGISCTLFRYLAIYVARYPFGQIKNRMWPEASHAVYVPGLKATYIAPRLSRILLRADPARSQPICCSLYV